MNEDARFISSVSANYNEMASGEILRRKKTDTISSSYCRLCHKFLVPTQAGKFATPRADLFLSLKNKEFTSHLEVQEVILSDLINSLTSQKIFENDGLPRVCCLPCGRSLVRSYATLNKLIKKLHDDPTGALKRKPPWSPGSPSTKVLPKKAKISDQSRTGLIGYTRRKILSSSSKENVGISPLTQQGQVSSAENKFEKSALSGEGDKSITQIFISSPGGKKVTYAPKGLEKTLVRAIAFQNPKCCARAALKLPSWKPFLITKFSSHLNKEAVTYFKRNNLLKMSNQSNPSDIARLKIEDVEKELHECMPTTMKFMEALSGITARRENEEREKRKIASGKKKKSAERKDASINRLSQELTARNCCTVAVSMLLKQHFANMSKLLYRSTLLMMNGGCRALDIDRLNSQGILMSHSSGVKMQNKMAMEFGKSVEEWKQDVTRKELMIRLLLDIHNQIKECDGNLTLDHIKSCPSYDTNVLDGVKSYIQCETDDPCKILDTTEKITKALKEIKQSIVDYR